MSFFRLRTKKSLRVNLKFQHTEFLSSGRNDLLYATGTNVDSFRWIEWSTWSSFDSKPEIAVESEETAFWNLDIFS